MRNGRKKHLSLSLTKSYPSDYDDSDENNFSGSVKNFFFIIYEHIVKMNIYGKIKKNNNIGCGNTIN